MRVGYILAVPLLATLFGARLLLWPRSRDVPSRARVVCAVVFALLLLAFLGLGLQLLTQSLGLGTLSPRPFMTRRVDLLIVEPQDNSFPSWEMALAAVFAVGLAFLSRRWGMVGAAATMFLGLARMFCGTNFLADVVVGALLGVGSAAFFGALFEVRLRVFAPQPRWQLLSSTSLLLLTLGGAYFSLASTPRFAAKLPVFWSSTVAAASESAASESSGSESSSAATLKPTRAARAVQEGEGVIEAAAPLSAEELALSKRSHLFLPAVEKQLKGVLTPLSRPFRLLDVEVAPVTTGDRPFRCAALRFEIPRAAPELRRLTAETAARLVKAAFRADPELQNIDITAIVRGSGVEIAGSAMRFAGDEVPVFTASIARQNLIVQAPRWANDPKLDAGSWLRTRSRLYINEKILPAAPQSRNEPLPVPFNAAEKPKLTPAIPLEDAAQF